MNGLGQHDKTHVANEAEAGQLSKGREEVRSRLTRRVSGGQERLCMRAGPRCGAGWVGVTGMFLALMPADRGGTMRYRVPDSPRGRVSI